MGGMAMLNYDVFEAFKSAGVPEEKARRAAEALSEGAQASEVTAIKSDVTELKTTVKLHTWMLGTLIAINVAVFARLFVSG
jgi:hypothetical protein